MADENNNLACIPNEIAQHIAKYCWHSTHEEINKITNEEIKQHLLAKYFPEEKN